MAAHDQEVIEAFNDSLERCQQVPDFLDLFYERFLAASPQIPAFFAGTDFHRQKRVLTMALYVLLAAADGYPNGMEHIDKMAKSHAERHIPAELYDVWRDCLINTVAACDPEYRTETGVAWREILEPGIRAMQARAVRGDAGATGA